MAEAAGSGMTEGATTLALPATPARRGPGRREEGRPFFNPGMALSRDLSVLLVQAYADSRGRGIDVADALAGAGARALRLAVEVDGDVVVHANDGDPLAVGAMRRGRLQNGVSRDRLAIHEGGAHAFLASRRFDVVDVDPFGSPAPFLDAAIRATRHDGLVCLTATDTAALAGAERKVCRRRYDAEHGLHAAPWRAEVGLRILAGAAVRAAGRFERAARPVLSIQHGHWMRVILHVQDGRSPADRALAGLAHAVEEDGAGTFTRGVPDGRYAGPLWAGPLHDAATVQALAARADRDLAQRQDVADLLAVCGDEATAPPFWLDPNRLRTRFGNTPPRDALMARLRDAGFRAARTHLDPQGIRTDATVAQLGELWSFPKP